MQTANYGNYIEAPFEVIYSCGTIFPLYLSDFIRKDVSVQHVSAVGLPIPFDKTTEKIE